MHATTCMSRSQDNLLCWFGENTVQEQQNSSHQEMLCKLGWDGSAETRFVGTVAQQN